MDAIDLLKSDHRTVEQLFTRYEATTDQATKTREDLVREIIKELSIHAVIEEQVFYPAVRLAVPDEEDDVLEALEEHHVVKWTLSELENLKPDDERFHPKVTVLMEAVRHHVEEEEGEMFPAVSNELSDRELDDLGNRLDEAKRGAPTHPHPRSPDSPPGNFVAGAVSSVMDKARDMGRDAIGSARDVIGDAIGEARDAGEEALHDARNATTRSASSTAETAQELGRSAQQTASDASAAASDVARSASRSVKETTKASGRKAASSARKASGSAKKSARKASGSAKKAGRKAASSTRKATGTAKKSGRAAAGSAKTSGRKASSSAKTSGRKVSSSAKTPGRKASSSAKKSGRKATGSKKSAR